MLVSNKLRIWPPLALIASTFGFVPAPANAAFLNILDTDAPAVASYIAATTGMAIPGPNNAPVDSLTGPNLTISLGSTMEKIASPGWPWGPSPFPDPDVLSTTILATSATFAFSASSTVTTFGFEAEPSPFEFRDITADFYNGASLLGSITLSVNGDVGSRLFAATLDNFGTDPLNTDRFTSVVISSSDPFAVGNIRYAATSPVPEPGTIAMVLGGLAVGLPALVIRRRRAKQRG